VFSVSMIILKSLNLTEEDWSENYTFWSLSWVFKCVWSYNDWEVAFLKKRKHRSSDWTKKMNEKKSKVLWDSLYNMMREKLLVLHKTLTELLNKQFIWVSNSFAAVSVLFIQKSEDELQFCVNYCDLNWITQKNCYSLSLIYETLQNIKQAQWYIKLNVIVTFHKIQIAAENEWKTAFHIRYEYKWMMTSFKLVNVSSTFQRYINWVLQNFLDEFCSVYVNDILIFTDESLHQHEITYKEYYYDFEKLTYRLTLINVSLKSSQSSILSSFWKLKRMYKWISEDEDNHELTSL
jgi:hypothetical protein